MTVSVASCHRNTRAIKTNDNLHNAAPCRQPHSYPTNKARALSVMEHLTPQSRWSPFYGDTTGVIPDNLDISAITHPLMTTTDVTNNDTHLWSRSQPFYSASDWLMPHCPSFSLVLANHPRVSETILIHIARNSATPAPWWARWHGEIRGYSTFNFITFWLPRPDTFSLSRTKKALVCINPLHWFEFHLLLLQLAILTSLSLLWLK